MSDKEPQILDDLLDGVGKRLRAVRTSRGLTLSAVHDATAISTSTLSRLEQGQRKATLELLIPLSRLYGVPIDEIVGDGQIGDPTVYPKPVRRNGTVVFPLNHVPGPQQALKILIPRSYRSVELTRHDGYEWLYVLAGKLRLVVGEQDYVLEHGEAAEFDTRVPHWFGSTGATDVEVLSVLGVQGRRIHLAVSDSDGQPSPGL